MYSAPQLALKYIRYYLTASNGRGHGVHSPFVFDFIEQVLNDRKTYPCYEPIEALRARLKQDQTILAIEDFGAGSRTDVPAKSRSVASIAHSALKPRKFGQLLHRIARYYRAKNILELGTSLGITSSYLACANPAEATLHTMEGAPAIAQKAREHFEQQGIKNITLTQGNFDHTLPALLQTAPPFDLVYIDGNHRKEPTVRYFKQLLQNIHPNSILIFDDNHWSAEMEEAWETIKNDERVTLSIDLFFIGLVFFKPDFKVKQHFKVRF